MIGNRCPSRRHIKPDQDKNLNKPQLPIITKFIFIEIEEYSIGEIIVPLAPHPITQILAHMFGICIYALTINY
jgi:hypothetical protein